MATARIPGQQRSADREAVEIINRTTKGGMTEASRKLRYKLKVIQQPERARACGSGAKSSADRRPVDPPPVVELKIFDVDEHGQEHDITFGYKANFFLFATLEMARPMAHGRVQPAAQAIPVLTGMPVSGMAYLDRPSEAGYFIFPDLSVRHEGKYKLSFNLYEQTKLDDDTDLEPATELNKPKMPSGNDPDSSFDWRLEVKSDMFTVYSAKKFPGLAESTTLSRTVAEQGCRVRIRRDVRMRRRETKGEFEDEMTGEQAYNRAGRPLSREDYDRARSGSRSLSNSPERSTQNGGWASNATPEGGHLNWLGGGPQAPNTFAAPMAPRQQQFPPGPFQPGPSSYQTAPHPGPQTFGYPHPQSAHPTYGQRGEYLEHDADPRRYSVPGPPRPYGMDTFSNQPRFQNHPPQSPHPPHLPPLRLAPVGSKYEGPISPHEPLSRIAPESPLYERNDRPYNQYPSLQAAPVPSQAGLKRDFGNAFTGAEVRLNDRLYDGMRPSSSHQNHADDDDDSGMPHVMIYKRAAGNKESRQLPAEEE